MAITYNIPLVLLSIILAFLASFTAIKFALRMIASSGSTRMLWHLGGSFSMGTGIWGMHFTGMVAVKLPISVTYDLLLTFASWLLAIIASIFTLWIISRNLGWGRLLLGSTIMGIAIAGVHYVEMQAMLVQPAVQYDSTLFILSFVIAIFASFLAMVFVYRLDLNKNTFDKKQNKLSVKISSAAITTVAICGMHYTGMAATNFPEELVSTGVAGLGGDELGILASLGVIIILSIALYSTFFDAKLADQNAKLALQLKRLNSDLVAHANELKQAKESADRNAAELLSYQGGIDQYALVSVTDHTGKIVHVNNKFIEISKYSREELLGQNHRIINSGTHTKEFWIQFWNTIRKKQEIWRGEICNRAKDGSLYWVDTAISPLKDDAGNIIKFISVRVDITQRKQYESELQQAKKNADDANNAKSQFLANMSHEIRTPMNSIIGMSHLLQQTVLNDKQHDYVSKIEYSSQHLLAIINDILDLSKIEKGKISIEHYDFDLGEIFHDISNQFSHYLIDKKIKLVIDTAALDLTRCFRGDALRLSQILINFVSNAVKFTEEGTITISVRILEKDDSAYLLRFEVQDTGIGIDKNHIDHLFNPFDQADTSTTRKYGGTGLGLAICKELAELMGGTVGVDSQIGQGSTFWFTVRLAQTNKTVTELTSTFESTHALPNNINELNVLVVEDNKLNQQVAKELLKKMGANVNVTIADNGEIALSLLSTIPFNCILMDVQMPIMDGIETTRIIRENPEWSDIPVIAMTANASNEDKKLCLDAGMNDFLSKPVNPKLLISILSKWCKVRSHIKNIPESDNSLSIKSGTDSIIDLSVLTSTIGDDSKQIEKCILLFLESSKEGLTEIDSAIEQTDIKSITATGHYMKSAALTVGAKPFADYCIQLEQLQHGASMEKAIAITKKMRQILVSIEKSLPSLLS